MRIVGIVASPNVDGRTTVVADAVLEGTRAHGADVDMVQLAAAGFETAAERLHHADGAVFVAPIYRARAAHPLKTFLDHLPRGMRGESQAPLQGKACAIALTGASWHHFLAVDELRGVLAGFFAAQVLSPGLYLPSEVFAGDRRLGTEYASIAARHGAALVDLTRAVRDSENLSALRPLA